jgi:hypothetical protein
VPEGKDDWKPHQKSMPMGRLTSLVANMPSWITMMVERDEFDVAPATPPSGPSSFAMDLKTRDERVKTMEKGVEGARKALQATTDDHLQKTWKLKSARAGRRRSAALRDAAGLDQPPRASSRAADRVLAVERRAGARRSTVPSADDQRF